MGSQCCETAVRRLCVYKAVDSTEWKEQVLAWEYHRLYSTDHLWEYRGPVLFEKFASAIL